MLRYFLIFLFSLLFISCRNQEKVKDEIKDSLDVQQINETEISDSLMNKIDSIIPDEFETKKSELTQKGNTTNQPVKSNITIKIFRNTEMSGFGYDIILDGRVYVHQPNIPALPGNNGFATEEKAKRVAELVVFKIGNNIMPPTVDVEELDSLGIK